MKALIAITKIFLFFGLLTAAIGGVLYYFFWESVVVEHSNMAPTMFEGDEILYWKGTDNVRLGEILVCEHPKKPGEMVIGRVIGRDRDQLAQDKKTIRLNGKSITSRRDIMEEVQFSPDGRRPRTYLLANRELYNVHHLILLPKGDDPYGRPVNQGRIPAGWVYLMSDTQNAHRRDSRSFGIVELSSCAGKAFMRVRRGSQVPEQIPYNDLDLL